MGKTLTSNTLKDSYLSILAQAFKLTALLCAHQVQAQEMMRRVAILFGISRARPSDQNVEYNCQLLDNTLTCNFAANAMYRTYNRYAFEL